MYSTTEATIIFLLQEFRVALQRMNKEYISIAKFFEAMERKVDIVEEDINLLSKFCKLNIDTLEILIDLLKEHLKKEPRETVKEDIDKLIQDLEKEYKDRKDILH